MQFTPLDGTLPRYPNIHLVGAHTRTQADVWSIEAAVESGRRGAQLIDRRVRVLSQHRPKWLKRIRMLDNLCYRARLPHLLDLSIGAVLLWAVAKGAGLTQDAASDSSSA